MPIWRFYKKKLILSYLPVHLIYYLLSSPCLPAVADDQELVSRGVGPELPGGSCQVYVTGSNSVSH